MAQNIALDNIHARAKVILKTRSFNEVMMRSRKPEKSCPWFTRAGIIPALEEGPAGTGKPNFTPGTTVDKFGLLFLAYGGTRCKPTPETPASYADIGNVPVLRKGPLSPQDISGSFGGKLCVFTLKQVIHMARKPDEFSINREGRALNYFVVPDRTETLRFVAIFPSSLWPGKLVWGCDEVIHPSGNENVRLFLPTGALRTVPGPA